MKKSICLLTIVLTAFLCISGTQKLQAQTNADHEFTIQTRYMIPMSAADRTEMEGLLKEYFDKVTSKNELILHQWNMNHHYTDDSRELITINEYANWNDIDKAADRNTELAKLAWPNDNMRGDFMGRMNRFFTHHKDGIFNSMPELTK